MLNILIIFTFFAFIININILYPFNNQLLCDIFTYFNSIHIYNLINHFIYHYIYYFIDYFIVNQKVLQI